MRSKKYFISVGEPWDFDSPDGQNIVNGVIIKMLNLKCLLSKANSILNLKGVSGDMLVLYPRYLDSDFEDLNKGANYVSVNGNLIANTLNGIMDMEEEEIKAKSIFAIIGCIRV